MVYQVERLKINTRHLNNYKRYGGGKRLLKTFQSHNSNKLRIIDFKLNSFKHEHSIEDIKYRLTIQDYKDLRVE